MVATDIGYLITTLDNPINPFEDFTAWYLEDQRLGYHSWEKVSRFMSESPNLTHQEELDNIEKAIDELIAIDFLGIYRKVDSISAKEVLKERKKLLSSIEKTAKSS